jgi:hypothetical protein
MTSFKKARSNELKDFIGARYMGTDTYLARLKKPTVTICEMEEGNNREERD